MLTNKVLSEWAQALFQRVLDLQTNCDRSQHTIGNYLVIVYTPVKLYTTLDDIKDGTLELIEEYTHPLVPDAFNKKIWMTKAIECLSMLSNARPMTPTDVAQLKPEGE